jgi:RNA polymerase sigma factor (sigma-70 family)
METPLSLLERLAQPADDSAWRRFDALYRPWIVKWIHRLDPGLAPTDSDDVTQDVMHALVEKIGMFRQQRPGAFRTWLRNFVSRRLKAFWRTRRRQSPAQDPSAQSPLEEIAESGSQLTRQWDQEHDQYVLRRLLELCDAEFSSERVEAFRRQVLEGESADDVATALGKSKNSVLIDKSRILSRLRKEAQGLIE